MVSIDVDLYHGGYPEKPFLAILDKDGLQIFRARASSFTAEFSLPNPPIPWDHMQSFPSTHRPFGVVLWNSEGYSYSSATVVCYVGGKFEIVFQGRNAGFADLNFDGIPEIVTSEYASEVAKAPEVVTVWAWTGKHYVRAAQVPPGQLWSRRVVEAVMRAKQ